MASTSILRRSANVLSMVPWKRFPALTTYFSFGIDRRRNASFASQPETSKLSRQQRKEIPADVSTFINGQVSKKEHGRLFAIVQLDSSQFKITDGDVIVLDGTKRYDIGDQIRLEKVLCVGGRDFTIFGRPLISRDVVNIEATVIEKTLNETQVQYFMAKRVGYHNLQFIRNNISLLLINRIELIGEISTAK